MVNKTRVIIPFHRTQILLQTKTVLMKTSIFIPFVVRMCKYLKPQLMAGFSFFIEMKTYTRPFKHTGSHGDKCIGMTSNYPVLTKFKLTHFK